MQNNCITQKDKCYQCGVCCKLFYINLNEAEYESAKHRTVFSDMKLISDFSQAEDCGANFLAKKSDGSCVYLENNSCSIHADRPKVCREFFCELNESKYMNMRKEIAKYKIFLGKT